MLVELTRLFNYNILVLVPIYTMIVLVYLQLVAMLENGMLLG